MIVATIRNRWSSFLGTFTALALGIAIVTAALLVHVSAEPSVPERYANAAVLVHGVPATGETAARTEPIPWSPQRTAELSAALAAVPGVAAAVPDRSFYAQAVVDGHPVGDVRADPQGHGWSSTLLGGYALTSGTAPAGPGDLVVPEDLDVPTGSTLTLLLAAGPAEFRVTGTLDGQGFYVTDEEAAGLADGVSVFGLVTTPGADAAAVDSAASTVVGADGVALYGNERLDLEPESRTRVRWLGAQLLVAMTLLSSFAAVFVVASTFAFGVAQRRRELGLLRTIGATPGQIRRMLFGEALGVGVVSSAAGVLAGALLAPALGGLLVDAQLEPPDFAIRLQAWPLAASALTGMVVAFLGVWAASRRAARVRPMEALREATVDSRPMTRTRWILGGLSLAAGAAMAVVAASADAEDLLSYSLLSAMGLIVGMTLLSPVIIPPIVRLVTMPFAKSRGATWTVVREGTLVAVRRVASTAAPVLVTVGFVVLFAGIAQTMKGASASDLAQELPTPVVVRPDGTPGLSDAAVAKLTGVVDARLPVEVYVAGQRVDAVGMNGVPAGTVAVTPTGLAAAGLAEGARVPVTFPDGTTAEFTVAVADPGPDALRPAAVRFARDVVREHAPNALTESVYLDGGSPGEVNAELNGLGALALDRDAYAAASNDREWELLRMFMLVLLIMAIGYTGLAIANTLIMANADRLKDFAVMRLSGAAKGQVLKVVAVETVLVVAVGTALGLAVALAALEGVRRGLAAESGVDVSMAVPWEYVGGIIGASLILALGASLVTARNALRTPAVRLAGARE